MEKIKIKKDNDKLNKNKINEMIIIYKIEDEFEDKYEDEDEYKDEYRIKIFGEKFVK